MKIKIILLFLFGFFCCVSAQTYKPLDTADYAARKQFAASFKAGNEKLIKDLRQKYPGRTGSELGKIYTEFTEGFVKDIYHKDYTFQSGFEPKINGIISRLREKNPDIPSDIRILIARDNTPNAMCLADGTFVINMGLLNWVENEAQLAAVLSHEVSHRMLNHSLNEFLKNIEEQKTDKALAAKLISEKANRQGMAFGIVKDIMYKKSVQYRRKETQADSLGYRMYKKTVYAKPEYIGALRTLQEFDTISPRQILVETYKKYFTLPGKAFKEKWLEKEDFSLYNYGLYKDKLDKDSLSTHPVMEKRIKHLQKLYPELVTEVKPAEADADFLKMQLTAKMEIMPNFYHSEDYGIGVYAALQFLQDDQDEDFYKAWLGKFFEKLYEARKNYTLNRYVDRVNPKEQSESYQQFLNFIWNLSLDDLKSFADFYRKKESV